MITMVMRNVCLRPTRSPEPPEHQGAEGSHRKAGGKGKQREDEAGRLVDAGEELLGDDRRERAVEVEVVPFKDGSETGGEDHLAMRLVDARSTYAQYICRHGMAPVSWKNFAAALETFVDCATAESSV